MQWFQTYCLPILLGIITTTLLFLSKWMLVEVFLPRYRRLVYKGLSIEGTWEAKFLADRAPDKVRCEEMIEVTQLADQVSGNISYVEIMREGGSIIRQKQFAFEGTFVDSVLSAHYWNRNRQDNGRGTFCLIVKDGETLVGKYSWLDPDTRQVEASMYTWKRKGSPEEALLEAAKTLLDMRPRSESHQAATEDGAAPVNPTDGASNVEGGPAPPSAA
jgi:hypothetical protein